MKPSLSLAIIVKPTNEEAKLLNRCLKSIYQWVSEICITITGKNEAVEKVAKKYNAKISYFKWINDFATARNFNFAQATGDFILWLDTDDIVWGANLLPKVLKIMDENGIDVGVLDYLYDFDKYGQVTVKHRKARIVKNDSCVKWMGKLHEDLIEQRGIKSYLIENIKILHKTTEQRKQNAQKRNLVIALQQLKENLTDPKNIWDVANAYLAVGENVEAIKYYLDFVQKTGSEEEKFLAYHRMAGAMKNVGEMERAIECEWEAMKIRPWYPDPYLGLGEIYYQMGKNKHAKEFFIHGLSKEVPEKTAIVWNPRDYDFNPLVLLSEVYLRLNKPEKAKLCLERCLKIYPKHEEIKRRLKLLDREIERLKEIDKICEKIEKAKTKEEIKNLIDNAPDELRCHPKLIYLRNIHFIKQNSSGKDLVIYCYHTEEEFDPEKILKEGRGGSEEAVYHISKRLANLGWNVTVYANCGYKEKYFGKVLWKPWWSFNVRDKQDILVVWRHPALYEIPQINVTKKYVWLHDILRPAEFTFRRLNQINKIFALSKWQRDLFPDISDDKFMVTGNGIDLEMIKKAEQKGIKRNPYRLIYTSSYDRGLETLLKLFPIIKKEIPQVELHIFYGWNIWDSSHAGNKEKMAEKERILKLLNQPGVYEHGRVSQEQILEEYLKSSILAYPTEFGEISFITGMKAQALGCIPVTTTAGCLDETIHFGLKVDSKNIYTDRDAQAEWINGVIELLKNPPPEKERQEMKNWARKHFNWDLVAEQWHKEFLKKEKKQNQEKIIYGDRFQWIASQCSPTERIIDIGGNKGFTFEGWDRKNIVTVDLDKYDVENFVQADAHHLPFKDKEFDTAVLGEILEHVDDPIQVLKEAKRVAKKKIIITVPNEYEWDKDRGPFLPVEEVAKAQGLTVEEMAKRDNPAIEFYTKDNYRHLHHQRYYTKEMLKEHLEKAGIKNYKIGKLYTTGKDRGFAFFTCICQNFQ